jgi:hypothetical protein
VNERNGATQEIDARRIFPSRVVVRKMTADVTEREFAPRIASVTA